MSDDKTDEKTHTELKVRVSPAVMRRISAAHDAEKRRVLRSEEIQATVDRHKAEKERDEARVALAAASGVFDQITKNLIQERDEFKSARDAIWKEQAKVRNERDALKLVIAKLTPDAAELIDAALKNV